MDDRQQVSWAVLGGAALGALVGYFFFTERGRQARARLEPALDELVERARGWRATMAQVSSLVGAEAGREDGAQQGGWRDAGPQDH